MRFPESAHLDRRPKDGDAEEFYAWRVDVIRRLKQCGVKRVNSNVKYWEDKKSH